MGNDLEAANGAQKNETSGRVGDLLDILAKPLARLAIAPFAIPLMIWAPIWLENRFWSPIADFVPSLVALLSIALALVLVFRLVTHDLRQSSIFATIATAFLLYAPSFAGAIAQNPTLRLAIVGALGLLAYAIARKVPTEEDALDKANAYLNLALLAFALPSLTVASYHAIGLEQGRPDPQDSFEPFTGVADESSPDVWHIVMDRYPNSETLERIYGLDNDEFLGSLRSRGFSVNETAHSNYQVTSQSLASTLNADYLDGFSKKIGHPLDTAPLFVAVRRNRAAEFFSASGFRIYFSGSWANITSSMEFADEVVNFRDISEVSRIVFSKTVAGELARYFSLPFGDRRVDQCLREKSKFAQLRGIAHRDERKFVFAHILIPHPPFVFGSDGQCQSKVDEGRNTRSKNFSLQLQYANGELINLIDEILAGPRPAVIMLHGDEGPFPAKFASDESFHAAPLAPPIEWLEAGPDIWKEKMGILMAIRHADGETSPAPETPINLYPLVLNRSFSGLMPIRPERSYFYRDPMRKYDYTDVTESLRSNLETTN